MDENEVPTENLTSQNVPVKSLQGLDTNKRSPFKELGCNDLESRKGDKMMKAMMTPSKFTGILELDEERNWRERTEVVTAIDHSAYTNYAKEMITEVINKIPSSKSTVVENKLLHPAVAEFRGSPVTVAVDSDSEYESAGELDDTAIEKTLPLASILPKANSTLLNVTSASNTPNRSDVGMVNTLLDSFENMKLNETYDNVEEDNFHDASDIIENKSKDSSPDSNIIENSSISQQLNPHNDTFDQLTASFEKVQVSDIADTSTAVENDQTSAVSVDQNKKEMNNQSDSEKANEVTTSAETGGQLSLQKETEGSVGEIKDDPQEDVILPKKEYNLEVLEKMDDPNFDPFSTKATVKNSPVKDKADAIPNTSTEDHEEFKEAESQEVHEPTVHGVEDTATPEAESKDIPTPELQKENVESDSSKEDESNTLSEEQHEPVEEIIPPQKGYNLDFLEKHDDPTFNPFATKTTVRNSPEKGENPVTKEVEEAIEQQPVEVVAGESEVKADEHHVQDVNISAVIENKVEAEVLVASEKTLDEEDSEKQDMILPKKEYNLDFLENLDDQSFNPFMTKTTVNNSPDKTKSADAQKVLEESEIKEEKEKPMDIHKVEEINEAKLIQDTEPQADMATIKKDLKEEVKPEEKMQTEEEQEVIPPQKGYNLDYLDNLDDPNFDPFATKTAVTNSPDKKVTVPETVVPKPKEEIKKSSVNIQPKNEEEKQVENSSDMTTVNELEDLTMKPAMSHEENEMKSDTDLEENTISSKKGYDLDFLENLDDPNFDPFATKAAVNNSPGKNAVLEKNDVMAKSKTEIEESVASKLAETTEPNKIQDNPKVEPVMATEDMKNKGISEVHEEQAQDEIIPPKKAYNLDFLDNLDDPNYDPFSTKATVSNSPDKKNVVVADGKMEEEKPSEASKLEEKKEQPKTVKKPLNAKKKKPVTKAPADPVTEEEMVKEPSAPKGAYNLDFLENLEDPNFNPFATKKAVINSPAKENLPVNENKEVKSSNCLREKEETVQDPGSEKTDIKDTKTVVSDSEAENLPKSTYQLDILDHLDDPNFNPFATKAAVSNSPVKEVQDIGDIRPSKKIEETLEKSLANSLAKGTKITKNEFGSSLGSVDFDHISKEAIRLASQVTPKPQTPEEPKMNEASQPRDVFSPLPTKQSRKPEAFGSAFGMDEFTDATELSGGDLEPLEEENFQDATCYPIFNNPEDLDVLGEHGTEGNKFNLVRNSLYVKFDPLVSGRESLAPYLAQQLLGVKDEEDSRRCSGLISFSPSPIKVQRQKDTHGTPVRAQIVTRADETLMLDKTLENTVTVDNSNISIMSTGQTHNSTVVSNVSADCANDTVLHVPVTTSEKMVPEHIMNERLKNLELSMQDTLLRKIRTFEEEQKKMKQQFEEQNIALVCMDEENTTLKATIVKMQDVLTKIMKAEEVKEKEHKQQLMLLENQYESKISVLKKESQQYQDELANAEGPFFDLVKKFERLREVTESLRRNEESLKSENEELKAKVTQKEETFKNILQTLETNYAKAQEEFSEEKEKHDKELGKASVMLKRAEVKIISLTSAVEERAAENRRLTALLDDITNKFG